MQGVNTADSAVRLTHLPTNTVVESQEERAQAQNKKRARAKLQAILYQREWEEDQRRVSSSRKLQIGNMNRNEKIRTYNFNRYLLKVDSYNSASNFHHAVTAHLNRARIRPIPIRIRDAVKTLSSIKIHFKKLI